MNKKKYLLIKYDDNWADEFNISGFFVTTSVEWEKYINEVSQASYPQNVYFGTNEFVEFQTFEDFYNRLTIKPISEEEFIILSNLFAIGETTEDGGFSYGIFLTPGKSEDYEDFESIRIPD
jgi:hypothetical protein